MYGADRAREWAGMLEVFDRFEEVTVRKGEATPA
jgi:hypothetical protein